MSELRQGNKLDYLVVKAASYFNMLHHFIHTKNGCGILIKTRKLSPLYLLETFAEKRPLLSSWGSGHHSLKLRYGCVPRLVGVSALHRGSSQAIVVTEEGFHVSLYQQFSFLLHQTRSLRTASSCISAWRQKLPAEGISEHEFEF